MTLALLIERLWYGPRRAALPLTPLAALYCMAAALRRLAYRRGWLRTERVDAPVVVVGNLTVGGTGKTPLVIWLAERLTGAGWRPGAVSRGYRGSWGGTARRVRPDSDPGAVGDEPVLLAMRTGCPVAVAARRAEAAELLLRETDCDVILCDDGLQHCCLARDLEVAVVDGDRRFGNGFCLPAGPLREPAKRWLAPGLVRVCQGGLPRPGELVMHLQPGTPWSLSDPARTVPLARFAGQRAHAVAGIAYPQRFFELLKEAGVEVLPHPFPDHHRFARHDVGWPDDLPVLMTEKDAVKCRSFADAKYWAVPVTAVPDAALETLLLERLASHRRAPAGSQ